MDVTMLTLATLADALAARWADLPVQGIGWAVATPLLTLALLASRGLYRPQIGPSFFEDVRTIIAAAAIAAMATTFLRVLLTDDPEAAQQAVRAWLFSATYLAAARAGIQLSGRRPSDLAWRGSPTLVVGAGEVGHLVARRLLDNPQVGLRPVGFADDQPRDVERQAAIPVLGPVSELEHIVTEHGVEQAILSFSRATYREELEVTRDLLGLGVSVSIVPRLFESVPDRISLTRVGGLPLVTIYPSDPRSWQFDVKYMLDRMFAALLLILISPLLLVLSVAVLIDLGRPILFRTQRVGLDGRLFAMRKLRTMRATDHPGEPGSLPAESEEPELEIAGGGVEPGDADRRTRLGLFLRRSSLDELPQLFNVLRGEMSLVGPRPERVGFVRLYSPSVYRYADRHRAKSGITGWAQVHGLRGQTSLAERVEWDNYYIENWSLWLDFKIMMLTLPAMIGDRAE